MKRGEQNNKVTGFYDEYKRSKARQQIQAVETDVTEQKKNHIIKIRQPPTVRAYGRVRLFFQTFLLYASTF